MIKIHFCRSRTLSGYFIQAATFSRWNHVAIEVSGLVYDSTFKNGVAWRTPSEFMRSYDEIKTVEIEVPNELGVLLFLESQLGKKYDWRPLVALPFRANWNDKGRWFCSELATEALRKGELHVLDKLLTAWRVTPRDLDIWAYSYGS